MDKHVLDDIYAFWFGTDAPEGGLSAELIRMWMCPSPATDSEIRSRFGDVLAAAAREDWNLDVLSREQAVALVVLFDQFPRNIHRTSGEAYAYDHLARDIARRLLTCRSDFTLMERMLLGLPFVHHEDPDDQDYALLIASEIAVALPPGMRDEHRIHLDKATAHRDIIRRFGRFPHRNESLGRLSTPEEIAFMAEHGRGF